MSDLPYQQPPSFVSRTRSLAPTPPPTSAAGFGNQGLTASNQTRGYSLPSSYHYQQPQQPPQQLSHFVGHHSASIPTTSYLQEPFQPSSYPTISSQPYNQQTLRYPTADIPRVSHSPSNHLEQAEQVSAIPQQVSGAEMSFAFLPPAQAASHYNPQLAHHNYYDVQPRGSMSDSFGSVFPPRPSVSDSVVAEREIARQRRKVSQDARRQNKIRVRKTRLPSVSNPVLGGRQDMGVSVDFSSAAPTYQRPYVHDPVSRSSSVRSLQSYASSAREDYNGVVSGAFPNPPYSHGYPVMETVPPGLYPNIPITGHNPPPVIGNLNVPPAFTPGRGPRMSHSPSLSPHPEPPRMEGRVVPGGKPEKPQCWEHGCNGREFSTFSNLLRHQREKSGTAAKSYCPNCGAEFTRTTARNGHMEHGKCKPRRPSDERPRELI